MCLCVHVCMCVEHPALLRTIRVRVKSEQAGCVLPVQHANWACLSKQCALLHSCSPHLPAGSLEQVFARDVRTPASQAQDWQCLRLRAELLLLLLLRCSLGCCCTLEAKTTSSIIPGPIQSLGCQRTAFDKWKHAAHRPATHPNEHAPAAAVLTLAEPVAVPGANVSTGPSSTKRCVAQPVECA